MSYDSSRTATGASLSSPERPYVAASWRSAFGRLLLTACFMAQFAGCVFMPFCADGRMFDKEDVSRIVEGRTTRQEIFALFGEPLETDRSDAASAEYWRYRYVYLGALGVSRADLKIHFDGDIVSNIDFMEDERRY